MSDELRNQVNDLVGKMEKGDDGKWVLPEEVEASPELKLAAMAERRYRDTQGAYTKSRQELKKANAIAEGLQEKLMTSEVALTKEQKYELNELKKSNPEKWRAKLNEYEEEGKTRLETELNEIRQSSANKGELEVRKEQMAAWSESTGITLDDDVVANDLPPRFMKDLESGAITFEQFLDKAGEFLQTPKTIKGADDDDDNRPNLGDVAGGNEPSRQSQEGDFDETYEQTIF